MEPTSTTTPSLASFPVWIANYAWPGCLPDASSGVPGTWPDAEGWIRDLIGDEPDGESALDALDAATPGEPWRHGRWTIEYLGPYYALEALVLESEREGRARHREGLEAALEALDGPRAGCTLASEVNAAVLQEAIPYAYRDALVAHGPELVHALLDSEHGESIAALLEYLHAGTEARFWEEAATELVDAARSLENDGPCLDDVRYAAAEWSAAEEAWSDDVLEPFCAAVGLAGSSATLTLMDGRLEDLLRFRRWLWTGGAAYEEDTQAFPEPGVRWNPIQADKHKLREIYFALLDVGVIEWC